MDTKIGHFIVHWSIAALKFFKENLSLNFSLSAVFMKVVLEITKRGQCCALPQFTRFHVYLRLANFRAYKGHLQNEWAIKPFGKQQKSSKFFCIKSCIIYTLFLESPRYLKILVIDFCETLHNRIQLQAPKLCAA